MFDYNESKNIYKMGVEKAKEKKYREAFELYQEAFLNRVKGIYVKEEEFILFFRYSLSKYLAKKKGYLISLQEGDAISDLIVKSYEEFVEDLEKSPIRISLQGRRNLLSSLEVPFPIFEKEKEEEGEKEEALN